MIIHSEHDRIVEVKIIVKMASGKEYEMGVDSQGREWKTIDLDAEIQKKLDQIRNEIEESVVAKLCKRVDLRQIGR